MTVEADGVFYTNVISITQVAPNKAVLVTQDQSVVIPIFCPIQIIGSMNNADNHSLTEKT